LLSIIFYNYKQSFFYSQTHQKKLERIDKVDERFCPLLPSDTRRDEEEINQTWEKKYGTDTSTPMLPRDTTNPHPEPLEVFQMVQDLSTDPSPQPSTE